MRRKLLAVIAIAIPGTLAACGGGNSGGGTPSTSAGTTSTCPSGTQTSGNGTTLSIGAKGFAEEGLMAQMTADVLNAHGFNVTNTFTAADKAIGTALTTGTIDMYWQYTGTDWVTTSGSPTSRLLWPRRSRTCSRRTRPMASAGSPRRNSMTPTASPSSRVHVGNVRNFTGGVRHLPDVASDHQGLRAVGVPHPARRSSWPRDHLRLAGGLGLPLHPDRHDRREGDR